MGTTASSVAGQEVVRRQMREGDRIQVARTFQTMADETGVAIWLPVDSLGTIQCIDADGDAEVAFDHLEDEWSVSQGNFKDLRKLKKPRRRSRRHTTPHPNVPRTKQTTQRGRNNEVVKLGDRVEVVEKITSTFSYKADVVIDVGCAGSVVTVDEVGDFFVEFDNGDKLWVLKQTAKKVIVTSRNPSGYAEGSWSSDGKTWIGGKGTGGSGSGAEKGDTNQVDGTDDGGSHHGPALDVKKKTVEQQLKEALAKIEEHKQQALIARALEAERRLTAMSDRMERQQKDAERQLVAERERFDKYHQCVSQLTHNEGHNRMAIGGDATWERVHGSRQRNQSTVQMPTVTLDAGGHPVNFSGPTGQPSGVRRTSSVDNSVTNNNCTIDNSVKVTVSPGGAWKDALDALGITKKAKYGAAINDIMREIKRKLMGPMGVDSEDVAGWLLDLCCRLANHPGCKSASWTRPDHRKLKKGQDIKNVRILKPAEVDQKLQPYTEKLAEKLKEVTTAPPKSAGPLGGLAGALAGLKKATKKDGKKSAPAKKTKKPMSLQDALAARMKKKNAKKDQAQKPAPAKKRPATLQDALAKRKRTEESRKQKTKDQHKDVQQLKPELFQLLKQKSLERRAQVAAPEQKSPESGS